MAGKKSIKQFLTDVEWNGQVITTLDELTGRYDKIGRRGIPLDPASRPKEATTWDIPLADGFSFSAEEDYTNVWVADGWARVASLGIKERDLTTLRKVVNEDLANYCEDVRNLGFQVARIPHPKIPGSDQLIDAMNFVYMDNAWGIYHDTNGERVLFLANFRHANRNPEVKAALEHLANVNYSPQDGVRIVRSPWTDEINGNFFYADLKARSDNRKKQGEGDEFLKANIHCFREGAHSRTSRETVAFTAGVLETHIIGLQLRQGTNPAMAREDPTAFHKLPNKEKLKIGGTYHGNVGMTFIGDTAYFIPAIFEHPEEVTEMMNYLFDGRSVPITEKEMPDVFAEAISHALPLNGVYLGNDDDGIPTAAIVKEAPNTIAMLQDRGVKVLPQQGLALGTGGGGFYCSTIYRHNDLMPKERSEFKIPRAQNSNMVNIAEYDIPHFDPSEV